MSAHGTLAFVSAFAGVLFVACDGAVPVVIGETFDAGGIETGMDAARGAGPCRDCPPFPEACEVGAFCRVADAEAPGTIFLALAARDTNDIWAVGSLGAVLRYDGLAWIPQPFEKKETFGAVLSRGAETWLGVSLRSSYILGADLPHDDGAPPGWARVSEDIDASSNIISINALWAFPNSDYVWVALTSLPMGEGTLARVRREGSRLVRTGIPTGDDHRYSLNAMTGSAGELWVAGEHGALYRIEKVESAAPAVTPINTMTMTELTALADLGSDVLATGLDGLIRRFDKSDPSPRIEPGLSAEAPLRGLHMAAPNDVWAVGDEASVYHYDGTTWARVPVAGLGGTLPSFRAVTSAGGHIWIAGARAVYELRRGDD